MNSPRIVVIGAMAVDVKARSTGALVRGSDVPGHVRFQVGGIARNVARNLALLGADVAVMSAVGDDAFGRLIRADLIATGLADTLVVAGEQGTAAWVGIQDSHGELDVGIFDGRALSMLTPHDVIAQEKALAAADLIALDATLARPAIDAAVRIAHTHRVPLYLNPASAGRAATVRDCQGDFDLVTANAVEAQVLTGRPTHTGDGAAQAARSLVARGAGRVIVTRGPDGIVYADAEATRSAPAHPTRVVETTGAGDALAAMFVLCHLRKIGLEETLARALQAAALTAACEESVCDLIRGLAERPAASIRL
ncbi:MAG: PfkB family carbohydrate kinase [Chloroflexi bacterium]|nr:PfkB family carbohydrate kinase [Chloroflexota bacterium]